MSRATAIEITYSYESGIRFIETLVVSEQPDMTLRYRPVGGHRVENLRPQAMRGFPYTAETQWWDTVALVLDSDRSVTIISSVMTSGRDFDRWTRPDFHKEALA